MVSMIRAIFASALVSLAFAADSLAAPGDPDASFGGDGFSLVDFSKNSESASAVDVMADGRIVIGGFWSTEPNYASFLARLMPDGSFDPSFGFGGIRTYSEECGGGVRPIRDLEVLADGRILTAGTCEHQFQLMRFNADGSDDLSFDGDKGNPGKGNGVVRTAFATDASAFGMAVDPGDGSITLGGLVLTPEQTTAFARYDSEGRLDKEFDGPAANPGGGNGKVVLPNPDAILDRVEDMVTLGAGRVAWTNNSKGDVLAGELGPDGKPLTSFGGDGLATADFGGSGDEGEAIAADSLGRVVVAGVSSGVVDSTTGIARFLPNGDVDPAFANPVINVRPGFGEQPLAVLVQDDGRILVVGYGLVPISEISSGPGRLVIVRLTPEGTLDPTFAAAGIASVSGPQGGATGLAAALDPAGRLVVTGRSTNYPASTANDVLVGRFLTASDPLVGPPPPSNRFKFAGLKRNKRKGTATLFIEVPGAGRVAMKKSKKVKGAVKTKTAAGKVGIPIKLKGKANGKLKLLAAQRSPKPGRLKVKVQITFTPTGGTSLTLPKQVSLVRQSG